MRRRHGHHVSQRRVSSIAGSSGSVFGASVQVAKESLYPGQQMTLAGVRTGCRKSFAIGLGHERAGRNRIHMQGNDQ
jgi:hypothetical protein